MLGHAWMNKSPLRLPTFRYLWLGLVISRLGDQFTAIALLWFVLQLTGSGVALGLVILCFRLPGIVTSLLLGRLLDRHQPQVVMGVDNAARALIIGAIPALYWLDVLTMPMVYTLALLAGALAPATGVGVRVVLPYLVDGDELENANALVSVSEQFSYLAGPALAGLLVSLLGGPPVLLIDAATFALMAALLFVLPDVPRQRTITEAAERGRWLGFGTLLHLKTVRIITALSLVFFFAYGPLEPALPIYSQDTLRAGAAGYGLLWSAFGVGALLGLLTIPMVGKQPRPGVTFAAIAVLWGILLAPLTIATSLPLAMLFLGLAGAAWAPYTTIETSLLQRLVPEQLRGQVFGAQSTLLTAAAPLGAVLGGVLLDHLSAPAVIGISALACGTTGVIGLVSPTLRDVRRVVEDHSIGVDLADSSTESKRG